MKWIAITQRVQIVASYGERRDALAQDWTELSKACGFLPLLLPNDWTVASGMLEAVSPAGIILSGGNDLVCCGGDAPERDDTERHLIAYAIETQTPLLGVCRGTQMLLDYFGTPLKRVENHVCRDHLLDNGDTVNSFHSWGAEECAPPLEAVLHSEDGIVEEVVHRQYPWIHGIMWHPERYHPARTSDIQKIREVLLK